MVRMIAGRARSSALTARLSATSSLTSFTASVSSAPFTLRPRSIMARQNGHAVRDHVHLGLEDFLDPDQVHALLGLDLHPHVPAAAAAAEPALAGARQLDQREAPAPTSRRSGARP